MAHERGDDLLHSLEEWREPSAHDPLSTIKDVGAAAIESAAGPTPLTPNDLLRVARAEIHETRSLFFHPIPTAQQELMMLRLLGEPKKGERKRVVSVRELLNEEAFLHQVAATDAAERQKWLYVLALSATVQDVLVACNYRLVASVAKQMGAGLLSPEDRRTGGTIGLMRAIERYDPSKLNPRSGRPYRFSSYATHCIRGGIQEQICAEYGITQTTYVRWADLTYFVAAFKEVTGKFPRADQLKVQLQALADGKGGRPRMSLRLISQLVGLYGRGVEMSLNQKLSKDSNTEVGNMVAGSSDTAAEALSHILKTTVATAIQTLDPIEQQLLCAVFGLDGCPPISPEQAGQQLGLDGAQARLSLATIIARLRSNQAMQALAEREELVGQPRTVSPQAAANEVPIDVEVDSSGHREFSTQELLECYDSSTGLERRAYWLGKLIRQGLSLEELARLMKRPPHSVRRTIVSMRHKGVLTIKPKTIRAAKRAELIAKVRSRLAEEEHELLLKDVAKELGMPYHQMLKIRTELIRRGDLPDVDSIRRAAVARSPETTEKLREWMARHPIDEWRYDKAGRKEAAVYKGKDEADG